MCPHVHCQEHHKGETHPISDISLLSGRWACSPPICYLMPRLNHQLQASPVKRRAFCSKHRQLCRDFLVYHYFLRGGQPGCTLRCCHMPVSAFNPYGKPHPQGYTTGDCAGFLPQHLSLRPFWQLAPKIWDNQSQEQELGCWGPSVDVARSSTAPGSAQLSQRKREENQLLPFKSGQNRFLIKAALNH